MGRWVIVVDIGLEGLNGSREEEETEEKKKKEARVVSELRVRNFKLRSPRG